MARRGLTKRAKGRIQRFVEERWSTRIWESWYSRFADNPHDVDPSKISRELYLSLAEEVRSREYPKFFGELNEHFAFSPTRELREFIDGLALTTQVGVKKRVRLLYLHGYLLYSALRQYVAIHPELDAVTVLETGTARGFSSVCMAKALSDSARYGKIITIDVLPTRRPLYWNCIRDVDGKKDRFQLLSDWRDLIEKYIIFLQGHSQIVLRQLGLSRVHFAFLDDEHTYENVGFELEMISAVQRPGDVIVCDDYTPSMFPGVVKAIDEFLARGAYVSRLFESGENRGYMYCRRVGN